jgi:hypothetical protein
LSGHYLFECQGGKILQGSDMTRGEYRWWSVPELVNMEINLRSSTNIWLLKRAMQLFQLWFNEADFPLQEIL